MPDITVYSSSLCGYCHAAKRLLQSKDLEFDEVLVDRQPQLRAEVMRKSGQRTVPQIWIGETHVGGYTDLAALEQSGELDRLLAGHR
ncbi:MAG: glutaredoxin 3 [Pseudomonadales bacterium]|nr:glutaredoxin 3 [Gammaproteobacteria bacterium]NNL56661.1 glutaredoxin 3 [Pseudomonadales bacterium]